MILGEGRGNRDPAPYLGISVTAKSAELQRRIGEEETPMWRDVVARAGIKLE